MVICALGILCFLLVPAFPITVEGECIFGVTNYSCHAPLRGYVSASYELLGVGGVNLPPNLGPTCTGMHFLTSRFTLLLSSIGVEWVCEPNYTPTTTVDESCTATGNATCTVTATFTT